MTYDIHNYPMHYKVAKKAFEKAKISDRNKKFIRDFETHMTAAGIGLPRIIKYLHVLPRLAAQLAKDFDEATKDDIMQLVCNMQRADYSEWTKKTYKGIIKRFYKWMKGDDADYPEEVKWIKGNLPRSKRPLPRTEDLLKEEDINKLLDVAQNPRDKALIAMLWESGARIGELGGQEVGAISFDQHGAVIMLDGKTGPRPVRLITSVGYLANWVSVHPRKHDQHAPLWVCFTGKQIGQCLRYEGIRGLLRKLFWKAGIRKKVHAHLFRHSRATFLANHLTEFQMNQYFGWVQGSDMPSTYVHLSGKSTDQALFKLYGIQAGAEEKHKVQQPRICSRCHTINPPTSELCCHCGSPLGAKESIQRQVKSNLEPAVSRPPNQTINAVFNDPEVKKLVERKLKEMAA